MEEEINIKELLISIWQGRYLILGITGGVIIIALLVSFVILTPLYEASAWVDLTSYDMEEWIVEEITGDNDWVKKALNDLVEHPDLLVNKTSFPEVYYDWVLVTVKAKEKELANWAIEKISIALIPQVVVRRMDDLEWESKQLDAQIKGVDQRKASYLDNNYQSFYERLDKEEESLEYTLSLLENHINNLYGDIEPEQKQIIIATDPTYNALFEKKKNLLSDLIEIELVKNRIKQGIITESDLMGEPAYAALVDKKTELLVNLNNTQSILNYLNSLDYKEESENNVYVEPASSQPVNIHWKLNVILAAVVGLMISFFVILFRAQFTK